MINWDGSFQFELSSNLNYRSSNYQGSSFKSIFFKSIFYQNILRTALPFEFKVHLWRTGVLALKSYKANPCAVPTAMRYQFALNAIAVTAAGGKICTMLSGW